MAKYCFPHPLVSMQCACHFIGTLIELNFFETLCFRLNNKSDHLKHHCQSVLISHCKIYRFSYKIRVTGAL